jgi:hypothetical protein
MANPLKGELDFQHAGRTYTLRLAADQICAAEAELDLGIGEIIERLRRGANFRIARAMLRAGLDGTLDQDAANAMITEIGIVPTMTVIMNALALAFPVKEEEEDDANPPREAAGGIGANSLPSGSPAAIASETSGPRRRAS